MDVTEIQDFNLSFKERLYQILDVPSEKNKISRFFDIFMMSLIGLNIIALILQTIGSLNAKYSYLFYIFEVFSVCIFTIEYLLRIWLCPFNQKYSTSILGRIKFCLKPLLIIDLLAILPFYLPFLGLDLRFLRVFRLFRLFRIIKIARYSQSLRLFGRVVNRKKEELIISLSFLLLLLILSSFLMYDAEHKVQPTVFSNIFDAFWWSIVTFSTVGYGDIYPKTEIGKCLASISTILGIMIFALPTSILTAGFMEEYHDNKNEKICPHCGEKIE
jgi:voltage-gated potassium channel